MRNLKKILALVLAMVMTFSVMATANAFSDDAKIDKTYDEAVEVLAALEVFEGYEDGSFQPKGLITRAEVAAIIYRIVTGDVDNKQVGIYADYNKFTDVKSSDWFAGYVNYCANAEYIKGYGDGKFGPQDKVTGYQALAMILRAIGYDKNGEFTGANWQVQTAAVGKKLGVTDNVSAGTLGTAATREVVAELLFQTIAYAPQVEYTVAFGYQSISLSNGRTNTLGEDTFGLYCGDRTVVDNWGRPGYYWYASKVSKQAIACIEEDALASYQAKATECDIFVDAGFTGTTKDNLKVWVNGAELGQTYSIQATDVYTKLGAQGRLTEIYKDRIVMIDTLLAKVTNVTAVKYDAAGHRMNTANLSLTVYDGYAQTNGTTAVVLKKNSDWAYAAGDYVLVNAETAYKGDLFGASHNPVVATDMEILGVAESFVGAQTIIHYNDGKRTIDGTTYDENNCYHLNDAGISTAKYTWFKDQYGNIIGSALIAATYEYGIIKNIQFFTQAGSYGYAQATVVMMDGSEKSIVISAIADKKDIDAKKNVVDPDYLQYALSNAVSLENGFVSTEFSANYAEFCGTDLFRIADNGNGTYTLVDTGNALISGTEIESIAIKTGVAQMGNIIVDSATQYLYRTVSELTDKANIYTTYTAVTGFNNVPNFTSAKVDYVDTDNDGRAELVYIIGVPASAKSSGLFYLGTKSYTQVVMTENGAVNYYELNGFFNGAEGTIKVKAANADLVTNMMNAGAHVLYDVKLENGYVVAATAIGFANTKLNAIDGYKGNYTGKYGIKYQAAGVTFSAKYADDVLAVTNVNSKEVASFNVTNATRVYGELVQGATYTSDKYVLHVVYDLTTLNAIEIYCYEIETGSNTMNPVVKNNALVLAQNGNKIEATYTNNTAEAQNVKVVYTYRVAGSNTSYATFTDGQSWTVAAGAADKWYNAAALTLPAFGQMYEVSATAYVDGDVVATSGTVYFLV